mgnify:FL=1
MTDNVVLSISVIDDDVEAANAPMAGWEQRADL